MAGRNVSCFIANLKEKEGIIDYEHIFADLYSPLGPGNPGQFQPSSCVMQQILRCKKEQVNDSVSPPATTPNVGLF
jgi:hypothetical protein